MSTARPFGKAGQEDSAAGKKGRKKARKEAGKQAGKKARKAGRECRQGYGRRRTGGQADGFV